MKKAAIVCVAALLLGGAPAAVTSQTITAHLDASVIGHPIYTADGMKIGRVTTIGTYHGKPTMIGEVARLMGFGVRRVLIPDQMATVQGDRVVLSIPSDRVETSPERGSVIAQWITLGGSVDHPRWS